jgi:hypothetical protein
MQRAVLLYKDKKSLKTYTEKKQRSHRDTQRKTRIEDKKIVLKAILANEPDCRGEDTEKNLSGTQWFSVELCVTKKITVKLSC